MLKEVSRLSKNLKNLHAVFAGVTVAGSFVALCRALCVATSQWQACARGHQLVARLASLGAYTLALVRVQLEGCLARLLADAAALCRVKNEGSGWAGSICFKHLHEHDQRWSNSCS